MQNLLPDFISKMKEEKLSPAVTDTFSYYYKKILSGQKGLIFNRDLTSVNPGEIMDYKSLGSYAETGRENLNQTVMVILNGGLGTSMGLTKAKSLLVAKQEKTFLELIIRQAERYHVQLALMNSFHTHQDTIAALAEICPINKPFMFLQNKFPKILQSDLSPAKWPQKPNLEWNPPGHGDLYTALYTSGTLHSLLKEGKKFAFIANSDNLGAKLDYSLLGYFADQKHPFMMEVSERTPTDIKGGHLARHKDGHLILRESAQCPTDEIDAFENIDRYRFFNTNNMWINLLHLKTLIEKNRFVPLPMIVNPKTLDPRDGNAPAVYQIESAMGSAISVFKDAAAVSVPRGRFFPVKKCSDLLALRSDCFSFSKTKGIIENPDRKLDRIKIHLDPFYYGKIDQFDDRFKHGAPSLIECKSLTVKGNVYFQGDIKIKGNVTISQKNGHSSVIKKGSFIDRNISV